MAHSAGEDVCGDSHRGGGIDQKSATVWLAACGV